MSAARSSSLPDSVSSYYCMCPHTTIFGSSCYCISVLLLLHMCPHTTIFVLILQCMCPHIVLILLRMCPQTTSHLCRVQRAAALPTSTTCAAAAAAQRAGAPLCAPASNRLQLQPKKRKRLFDALHCLCQRRRGKKKPPLITSHIPPLMFVRQIFLFLTLGSNGN